MACLLFREPPDFVLNSSPESFYYNFHQEESSSTFGFPICPETKMPTHTTREKLARRACDSCKIRKVRCSEVAPCTNCAAARVQCTFDTTRSKRGPRGLRPGTIAKIDRTQGQTTRPTSAVEDIVPLLDIYTSRLYPIWPIVDIEQLKRSLHDVNDIQGRRLAESIARATIAQLNLGVAWTSKLPSTNDAGGFEQDLITGLRVSFFSHVYHENLDGGGHLSLLHLRNAITQAQILRLEHESTYAEMADGEEQMLRRVLWLLFVTERYVLACRRGL